MTFSIEWHPQAYRVLRKLPQRTIRRMLLKLDFVAKEPFRYLEHYEGDAIYKLRIGTYRLLVDVNLQNNILLIQVIDKRGRVYKR